MDAMPNDERIARIRQVALSSPGVLGVEKTYARKTGLQYHVEFTHRSRSELDSSSLARPRNRHPVLDPGST